MRFVEYLEWDSQFFGFNIGRINLKKDYLTPKALDIALLEARNNHLKCLYLEIAFGLPEVVAYCSENKFSLVDLKTTLSKTLFIKKNKFRSENVTHTIKDDYYPFLKEIVGEISRQSRYFYDPKFGIQNCLRLYEEWLRKSIYEKFCNDMIIYLEDQKPVGFITVRVKRGIPFIDLLGVSNGTQKKGIGICLIDEVERSMYKSGYKALKVITQGHNIKALRLYQRKKFKIESVNIFYHKWLD
jgi:ribosomal protein S18 acetylase RimI-like enzyme